MFTRMLVAAALLLSSGAALASDASYDQAQIRDGNVTLVEGSLQRPAPKAANAGHVEKSARPTKTGHAMACSCRS